MDSRRRAILGALGGAFLPAARAQDRKRLHVKKIPSSGETLPVIGVGTWQTFDVGADAAARQDLREVLKLLEGNVVDSSPMYGSSESVAGELVAELGMRERLFVATKVWTSGRAEGVRQIEESFRRLRVERMDLFQIHNLLDVATHTATLKQMKAAGTVRYVGITHYTSSAYAEVERWLKTREYDFLQINYSLGEHEAENRLLPLARDLNVAVIGNRPFAEGRVVQESEGQAPPCVGGRDRRAELGAVLPQVDRLAPGADLHHPRHRQPRAHARQPRRRPGRAARRRAAREDAATFRFALEFLREVP